MIQEVLESNQFIMLIALLLIISIIVTKFSSRLGVPSLVLFIAVGMLVGNDGLGFINFNNPEIAQLIGVIALIVILFEGGMLTKWKDIRPVIAPSITLATVGVILTTSIVALAAKFILHIGWAESFLVGSIVGSTDAAAVFAVLKGKNVKPKLEATLEAESGTNDPMAVFLTIAFIQLLTIDQVNVWTMIGSFFWQMGAGLAVGAGIGYLASASLNRINLDSSGLYPLFALGFAFLSYSSSSLLQASGLLAVYVTAVVIGNAELAYRYSILRFHEGFGWMAQILMFIILGLFVSPTEVFTWPVMLDGLLIAITLIFIARPVATFLSLSGFSFNMKEKYFLSWAGLRGAVPIVLAIFPMLAGLENSQLIFNVVFFTVLTSALVQGSSITRIAERFHLVSNKLGNPIHSLELISIGKANVEMIEFDVTERNVVVGQTLENMELPDRALINAIIREGDVITPYGQTEIKAGDTLYILVARKNKKEVKRLLEAIKNEEAHEKSRA
ncbi:cell volume regulation protein A [Halobacillus karajensis]|uniref:Potassium/proton antiporter n=1 Tax=Halobacillus karajensis TaxID=195088 RepID=A0A024P7L0_9BACI|nr:potassium/proton antiporter [Halobacillus karajensis]CDQ21193.1 potassium/proton antiporter [Halobacillus karajensis]CDQ24743.1 potassium/proton antiporter [Halobacillus karajensis]CDQ28897.1 potassium/proton antiporter [Halobacillus karajensis]SEH95001.1 cell volume regulation protein A [Halobacillus karajensis]